VVAHSALQSLQALLGAGARRSLAVGTCLALATTASACSPDLTGLENMFDTPTTIESANRTAEGDWNVHLASGGYCLVFAAHANTAQRAIEVCRARLAGT
jgi:hypothetical protein